MKTLKHIMFTTCLVALTILVACAPASETAPVPDSQETTQDTGTGAGETTAAALPETEIPQAENTATGAEATKSPVAEPELPQPEEKQPKKEKPNQKDQTLTPFGEHRPEEIFLTLSGAEQHCISENFTMEEKEQMLELISTDPRNLENASRMMRCAGEKTLLRVLITSIVTGPQPLTEQTSHCVWKGFSKIDMEGMIRTLEMGQATQEPQEWEQAKDTLAASMIVLHCLNDEEWERTEPDESMEAEREMIACAVDEVGGPENIRENMDALPRTLSPMFELMMNCPPPPQDGWQGYVFNLGLMQLNVRPCSRAGSIRYRIAPKCSLSGPFCHSGVGQNPAVAGLVRSYDLVFTYPCQPQDGG